MEINSLEILEQETKQIIYDNWVISLTKDFDLLIIQIKGKNSIFKYEKIIQKSSLNKMSIFTLKSITQIIDIFFKLIENNKIKFEEIGNSFKLSINYSSTEHFSLCLNKQLLSMEEIANELNNKVEEIKNNYINKEIFNKEMKNLHKLFEERITKRDKAIKILRDIINKQEIKIKNLEDNINNLLSNRKKKSFERNNHINISSNSSIFNNNENQNYYNKYKTFNSVHILAQKLNDKKNDLTKSPTLKQNVPKKKLNKDSSKQIIQYSNLTKNIKSNKGVQKFSLTKSAVNKSSNRRENNFSKTIENENDNSYKNTKRKIDSNLMVQTQRNSLNRSFIGSKKNNLSKSPLYRDSNKNEFNLYKKKLINIYSRTSIDKFNSINVSPNKTKYI